MESSLAARTPLAVESIECQGHGPEVAALPTSWHRIGYSITGCLLSLGIICVVLEASHEPSSRQRISASILHPAEASRSTASSSGFMSPPSGSNADNFRQPFRPEMSLAFAPLLPSFVKRVPLQSSRVPVAPSAFAPRAPTLGSLNALQPRFPAVRVPLQSISAPGSHVVVQMPSPFAREKRQSRGKLLAMKAANTDSDESGLATVRIPTPFDAAQRLGSEDFRKLLLELLDIAKKQDPQIIIRRALDLVEALRTVSQEAAGDLSANKAITAPKLLRRMCEQLGATYVKLGQFIASSPTLFPAEFVEEFQTVLDQTPAMPWSVVKPLIEKDLGKRLSEVYSSVDEKPLAAASIAQVHAAKLLTGEDVVIKVQRQGVEGSLRADLDVLYATARTLEVLGVVTSDFSELVGTLRQAILEEIDFVLEAKRTTQFAEFLESQTDIRGLVMVPKVYPAASSERIITLERLYGVPLVDVESMRQYTDSPEQALIVALNTWVRSVLTNEWFHADLHAGNLLMLRDGRVAFIDFGIVGSIPRKTVDAMLMFLNAFAVQDMKGIAAALTGMGFTEDLSEESAAAFARDLKEVLDQIERTPPADLASGQIDETQLNQVVATVSRIANNYGIRFPREFALLIKQVLYFDRYTSVLAPDLDVLNDKRVSFDRGTVPVQSIEAGVIDAEVINPEVLPPV